MYILKENEAGDIHMSEMSIRDAFSEIGPEFNFAPLGELLQPFIKQVLVQQGKAMYRAGTLLVPTLMVWLVLALTLRRDLSYPHLLNWMLSGFRWLEGIVPAMTDLVQDGAISHARVKLGWELFRDLLRAMMATQSALEPDFQGRISLIFDGSTGTMPDTEPNQERFAKPSSRRHTAAFPQVRMMALCSLSVRLILEIAYAPYRGKGSGERALVREILDNLRRMTAPFLFLMDAGLYAFDLLWEMRERGEDFLIKVPATVKFKVQKRLSDGSYLSALTHKVADIEAGLSPSGRQHWKTVSLVVRVIDVHIPGFRPHRLVTSLLEEEIAARELALHYHQRWDVEIAYDEIKTHQCATLRGQSPTTFRSKRPDLVIQELYAMLIVYNAIRLIIAQAAHSQDKDPRSLSFLDALQHMIDAAPIVTALSSDRRQERFQHLLQLIAHSDIDRPRRPRLNPRVVKLKMSKFTRKHLIHRCQERNIAKELKIIPPPPDIRSPSSTPALLST